jgi:kynurenine formamidase
VNGFYLQGSSQWDGLTHMADPVQGYYNPPRAPGPLPIRPGRCGIDRVAELGIFTRGALADVQRYFAAIGRPWSVVGSDVVSTDELRACLAWQRTSLTPGDFLLVRTGWLTEFLAADRDERAGLFRRRDYSGLSGSEEMWAYLWDSRVAGLASDAVAVEVFPPRPDEPSLHWAIARLGLTLGEMFSLDAVADACRQRNDHAFLFIGKPLNLRGGVGSPANAMAVI